MLKKILLLIVFGLFITAPNSAQKLEAPKLTEKPLTSAQSAIIREGNALHDAGKYAEAIAKYEQVLAENPDNETVLYELALSHNRSGNFQKATEYIYRASQYKTVALPDIYIFIGNDLDERLKQPDKAVEIYKFGIKQYPTNFMLHFNLGLTQMQQNQLAEARESFKKSAGFNPNHASSHLALSRVFYQSGYKIPALFAASRFLVLEPNTQRSDSALRVLNEVLRGGVKQGKDSNTIDIIISADSPTDEGDFGSAEMMLGLLRAGNLADKKDEKADKKKTAMQEFVDEFSSFIGILSEIEKKDRTKFTAQQYVPYFVEMKKRNFIEPFAYLALKRTAAPEIELWLADNNKRVVEFLQWSERYQFPPMK